LEISGVVDCRFLASIWPTDNLAGIVISVKFLTLKYVSYIEDTCNVLKAQTTTFGHKKGRAK